MPHFSVRHYLKRRRAAQAAARDVGPAAPTPDAPDVPLPHERDESLGATAARPDPVVEQAKRDLDAGQVDTDLHGTPGADAERRKELLERERRR